MFNRSNNLVINTNDARGKPGPPKDKIVLYLYYIGWN